VPNIGIERAIAMRKLTWHKVVTLVAAIALGSACIANDALARGGGGGYGGGHLAGYPGYYGGSGPDFGEYVEPGYYGEGKRGFDEDEYVEPAYPGLYGFYPFYRPYSSTR
jgi:uncharacterized membrane protein